MIIQTFSPYITAELQREALDLFKKQNLKGSSVIDCANAVVKRFHIPQILEFAGVYAKKGDYSGPDNPQYSNRDRERRSLLMQLLQLALLISSKQHTFLCLLQLPLVDIGIQRDVIGIAQKSGDFADR